MTYSTMKPKNWVPTFKGEKDVLQEDDFLSHHSCRYYLLEEFLAQKDLMVAFGQPKSGKTLFWLRAARRISQGLPVYGRGVAGEERVIYIATEGVDGLADRVEALRQTEGSASKFYVITKRMNLMDPEVIEELIDCSTDAGLVVLDTLGRAMATAGLDENGADMGRLIANIDRLRAEALPAVVLLTHGTKAGGNGPRGSLSLTAAADAIVSHNRLPDGTFTATLIESRDLAPGLSFRYGLRPVSLPDTLWRNSRTGIVAEELPEPERKSAGRPKAGYNAIALDYLQKAGGQVSLEQWRAGFDEALPALTVANRRQQFRRTRMELETAGQVVIAEGMVRQTA